MRTVLLLEIFGLALLGVTPAAAGECTEWDDPSAMDTLFASIDPNHLTRMQTYYIGCLDTGLHSIVDRIEDPPSLRALYRVRVTYELLSRSQHIAKAMLQLSDSKYRTVRCRGRLIAALLGERSVLPDLYSECQHMAPYPLVLAILGDSAGIDLAIDTFDDPFDTIEWRIHMLDALFYFGTPKALAFVKEKSENEPESFIKNRAEWMLGAWDTHRRTH